MWLSTNNKFHGERDTVTSNDTLTIFYKLKSNTHIFNSINFSIIYTSLGQQQSINNPYPHITFYSKYKTQRSIAAIFKIVKPTFVRKLWEKSTEYCWYHKRSRAHLSPGVVPPGCNCGNDWVCCNLCPRFSNAFDSFLFDSAIVPSPRLFSSIYDKVKTKIIV